MTTTRELSYWWNGIKVGFSAGAIAISALAFFGPEAIHAARSVVGISRPALSAEVQATTRRADITPEQRVYLEDVRMMVDRLPATTRARVVPQQTDEIGAMIAGLE